MARPLRIHVPGAAYHVMGKGNRGEFIFASPDDKGFFIQYLGNGVERYGIDLHAWCLMDNHYHLLLSDPGSTLTPFMHYLGSSYGTHMRRRRGMIGHVFSGRFRSICVQKEKYLVELSRYIHLNPLRAKIVQRLEEYPWSSYGSYAGHEDPPPWLNWAWILGRFGRTEREAKAAYRLFVSEGVKDRDDYPVEEMEGKAVLGDEDFIEKALRSADPEREFSEITVRRAYESPVGLKRLSETVCDHYGVDSVGKDPKALDMFVWLSKEKTRALNREIAALTGHGSPSSIPHRFRQIEEGVGGEWKEAEQVWCQAFNFTVSDSSGSDNESS